MGVAGRAIFAALLAVGGPWSAGDDFADEAFLEFLGSFDDGEGNWMDPTQLMNVPIDARRDDAPADDETAETDETDEPQAENAENDAS